MNTLCHPLIKGLLFINCYFCFNSLLHATTSTLESNSPFLPTGYSKPKPPQPKPLQQANSPLTRELEFRGIVQLNGIYHFSLFKKSDNKGYWISENESESGIGISDFDTDSMEITVTANGRSEQLTLMSASDNPLPIVAKPSLPIPEINNPNLLPGIKPKNHADKNSPTRRTIPRRRVIVPTKQ